MGLTKLQFTVAPRNEKWIGGIVGVITGVVSAGTGVQVFPSMNHNVRPNTDFRVFDKGYAIVDIAAGEEITCNYFEFDPEFRGFGEKAIDVAISAMAKASRDLREVAGRALAGRRGSGSGGNDLVSRLVAARDPATGEAMPDSLIIDNLVTFLLAGHETTAQALTWTLYLLALFPEWQDMAREEIGRVAGGRPIDRDVLKELSLVEAIFQEAMRLYPPAPSLMRRAIRRTELGGRDIKQGATVIIPVYVVHRHQRLWHDPLKFDPARFSPEARAGRHRCAYMAKRFSPSARTRQVSPGPRSISAGAAISPRPQRISSPRSGRSMGLAQRRSRSCREWRLDWRW